MCFCSTPLQHEQTTVYDHYLTNFETTVIDDYVEFDGESFFTFLQRDSKKM
jgi:hypothetical protein